MTRKNQAAAKLYYNNTGDPAPARDIAAALAELPHRQRRAIELRTAGNTWEQIGRKLHVTRGAACSVVRRSFNAILKRLLALPRYHQIGHPPPPACEHPRMPKKPATQQDPHKAVADAQRLKLTPTLKAAADPPPRDAKGRIVKRKPTA
jgi:hypothetical protein